MPAFLHTFIRTIASRLAAVFGAMLITFAIGTLGIPVSDAHAATLIAWLTTGLTGLGWVVVMVTYAPLHKLLSRWWNPADAAAPEALPEARRL
jgi:hypothetical protein